ncbi:putative leucine-rich repeat-containing protein DDB_G0290503 [Zerene cesonia]|uniref:putative leucine-rich repeat-containing protein DDB_G0290503 n=1 Tax=Zerene cesonia TaxID=33412 RepID=UPI0018E5A88A|nr:putative leucine-rich repeat-containing protein DDB_G0290503 [Zerene cesonia]
MDFGEISNVVGRKRVNVDVEKLREKVSRETAKVIKLKVAQDTAYWDLKEKLQQVEGNHERLQQNMVEVQMQHETISGQYQDELRLRPETLNKLSSTREICDVLEDYSERLKQTLSRCKADQASLCDAYQKSGQLVRDIKAQRVQNDEKHGQLVMSLEEKIKLSGEHQRQLMQVFTASKQQLESELNNARVKVASAQAQAEDLKNTVNELHKKLDIAKNELEKKEETISNMQRDMKQLLHEFNSQSNEMRNMLAKQEKDLKESMEANSTLKKALTHQEQFAKSMCDQNSSLQDKIAALEEEQSATSALINDLKKRLEEATSIHENINKDMKTLIDEKHSLEADVKEKDDILKDLKQELVILNEQITLIEQDKSNLITELNKKVEEVDDKWIRIQVLGDEIQTLQNKINEIDNDFKNYRESTEEKILDLTKTIDSKDKELDLKASTIAQLMSELKTSTDVRNKLENALQRCNKELEVERENSKEMEMKMAVRIEQLEAITRDKEDELSKQMSIILEMRSEKDRLQEKIAGMQGTIDNIQKELNGRPAPRDREPAVQPEPDDNAVMLTPASKKKPRPVSPIIQSKREFAVPRSEPNHKMDSMLYTLFSDSSTDGDTIDASEVNRRFSAISRGERLLPMPLSTLKRRSAVPAGQGRNTKSRQNDVIHDCIR